LKFRKTYFNAYPPNDTEKRYSVGTSTPVASRMAATTAAETVYTLYDREWSCLSQLSFI